MTITTRALLALVTLAGAGLAQAQEHYSGVDMIRGTVVSVGRVDPTENIDTGFFVDANYTSVALNGGLSHKRFGESPVRPSQRSKAESDANEESVTNAFAGIGFGRIVQIQYGYGNHGGVLRFRSDFNFRSVLDFLTQQRTPKDRMTLGDRITFTVAAEKYQDSKEEIFDNATWGVGLLF